MDLSKDKLEEILINIGYSKVGGIPDYYRIKDDNLIDVSNVNTVESLCKVVFMAGSAYRSNEIKKALQLENHK